MSVGQKRPKEHLQKKQPTKRAEKRKRKMPLNKATRLKIVLDLVKNGLVSDEALYDAIDQVPTAVAVKHATRFYDTHNGPQMFEEDGTTPRDPTNKEAYNFMINGIRTFIGHGSNKEIAKAEKSARAAKKAEIDAELLTDLGAPETEE